MAFPAIMAEKKVIHTIIPGFLPYEVLTLDESTLLNTLLRTLDKGPQLLSTLEEMSRNVLCTPFHVTYFLPLLIKEGHVCPTIDGKYEKTATSEVVFLPNAEYVFGCPFDTPMRAAFAQWNTQNLNKH